MCFKNEALCQILCCTQTLHNIQHTRACTQIKIKTNTYTHTYTYTNALSIQPLHSESDPVSKGKCHFCRLSVGHCSANGCTQSCFFLNFINNISKCCSCQRDADLLSSAWLYLKPTTMRPTRSFEAAEGKLRGARERTLTRQKSENATSNLSPS